MKQCVLISALLAVSPVCFGQSPVTLSQQAIQVNSQQLENIVSAHDDQTPEDDSYLQQAVQYLRDPIDLNSANEESFKELQMITPLQVSNLILYREKLGRLIDIYELQAVPGWDIFTIEKIRSFITVNTQPHFFESIKKRMKNGSRSILLRISQTLESSAGYHIDPASGKNYYAGSPQKILLRYRYNYKNLLQYGVLGEKDPGEQLFKGAQKQGFDFYSAHFFVRRLGMIKSMAIGDYSVNLGQGLIQWMSLAFKKGPDVSSVKREADVLRPYSSSGEINFHRGFGITLVKRRWEVTGFASYRKIDANFAAGDTTQSSDDLVTSFQTSGYHRTPSESADKGSQRQLAFGGNISYQLKNLHLGLNAIHYTVRYPLIKQNEPYNLYALTGKAFGNYSADYSLTYRNVHLFGEVALTEKKYPAVVCGTLISAAADVDLSLLYRNISAKYQSLYSDAFTENSAPSNEKGFFTGITIRPAAAWRVNAYADLFSFPWLKYRVNMPGTGSDYMAQLTYRPDKLLEIYTRFKAERKPVNFDTADHVLTPVTMQPKQDWRVQVSYRLSRAILVRSRTEAVWFDKKGAAAETGFLINADLVWHPVNKPWSGNIRVQYFETEGYNSRIYGYEDDVLYSYSIPVLYGKGYTYYLNCNYDLNKRLSVWLRCAQTLYPGQKTISSYLDQINGTHKTELRAQFIYKF